MRKSHLLIYLLVFSSVVVWSQKSDYTKDTTFISEQINACKGLIFKDPDQAQFHIDSAFSRSQKIGYAYGFYSAHNFNAIKYFIKANYEESINEYRTALKYVDPKKPEQKIRLFSNISLSHRMLNNQDSSLVYLLIVYEESKSNHLQKSYQQSVLDLATFYLKKEDYVSTVKYFVEAESFCENSTDTVFLIKVYSSLAMFYDAVNDFDKSIQSYNKAILLNESFDGINFLSQNYANLGETYRRLKHDYDTAIYYFRKAISLALPYEAERRKLIANINIGNAFLDSHRIDSAYIYYLKAYNSDFISKMPDAEAAVLINLGMYYHENAEYDQALVFLNEGLEKAKKHKFLTYQKNALENLSDLERTKGNYQLALKYHILFHELSDSLKKQEARHEIAVLDYEKLLVSKKYNNELLIHKNKLQEKQIVAQQIIIVLVIMGVVSMTIFLYVFWKNRKTIKSFNRDLQVSNDQLEMANEQLLMQKEEMKLLLMSKDRFVSTLGHDLKNPFSGLLGLLELMLEDWGTMPDSEKKEGIHHLSLSARQTYEFLQSLLDWGKAQQGLIKTKTEKFYLKPVAEEILVLFYAQYKKKNVKAQIDISENLEVTSDRKLISQILQNFFTNALKYSHEGGAVQIVATKKDGHVILCVKDEGIGIPNDKIKDLFKLDSNYHRTGTAGEKSTGMGLILCSEYVNLLGGEIKVNSQVNVGSEFCIIIDE